MCMYVVFCKLDHCIHIRWCIVMGLGHNDPWVESHMWPQQTRGQRSSRGQWLLVQVFWKKGQCIHILWCIFKSNITIIAKVWIAKAGETRGSRTALLVIPDIKNGFSDSFPFQTVYFYSHHSNSLSYSATDFQFFWIDTPLREINSQW